MAAFVFVRSVGTTVTGTGTAIVFTVGASGAGIGDLIAVGIVSTTNGAASGVIDSKGNVYQLGDGGGATGIYGEIWLSRLGTALVSGDTITVQYGSSQTASVIVGEVSGGVGATVDKKAHGTAAASDVTPTVSITPSATGALVLGLRGNSVSATEDVEPTSYTTVANKATSVPSAYLSYSILTTPAARALSGQWSAATGNLVSVNLAVFNAVPSIAIAPENALGLDTEAPISDENPPEDLWLVTPWAAPASATTAIARAAGLAVLEQILTARAAGLAILEKISTARAAGLAKLEQTVTARVAGLLSLESLLTGRAAGLAALEAIRSSRAAGLAVLEKISTSRVAGLINLASEKVARVAGLATIETQRGGRLAGLAQLEKTIAARVAGVVTLAAERTARVAGLLTIEAQQGGRAAGRAMLEKVATGRIAAVLALAAERSSRLAAVLQLEANRSSRNAGMITLESAGRARVAGLLVLASNRLARLAGTAALEKVARDRLAGLLLLEAAGATSAADRIASVIKLERIAPVTTLSTGARPTRYLPQRITVAGRIAGMIALERDTNDDAIAALLASGAFGRGVTLAT